MRRILLFFVALAVALVGTSAVFVYVSRADARAMAGQQPVKVLTVGEAVVAAGTTVARLREQKLLEVREMPRSAVPAGALTDLEGLED